MQLLDIGYECNALKVVCIGNVFLSTEYSCRSLFKHFLM